MLGLLCCGGIETILHSQSLIIPGGSDSGLMEAAINTRRPPESSSNAPKYSASMRVTGSPTGSNDRVVNINARVIKPIA